MLAQLEITLDSDTKLSYQMGSLFHGALMEILPQEDVEILHQSKLHPYTQHLEFSSTESKWIITALNQEMIEKIFYAKLLHLKELTLKKPGILVRFAEKHLKECSYKKLTASLYSEQAPNYIQLHFIVPTAFKSNGKVLFYPDIRAIYISLMNKYAAAVNGLEMRDEEMLEELCARSQIVRYDLKSAPFYLESVKINAFIGKIVIKLSGTQTMRNFANLLFQFGIYSGVGIKTSLGMGAYKIIEKGEVKQRDREAN